MLLSILHLNLNAQNFWDNLVVFLKNHDFDILQFQEVCGQDTISININTQFDGFKKLQELLGSTYAGELAIAQRYTSSPSAYMANATFYRNDFKLLNKNILTLFPRTELFPSEQDHFEDAGRNLLHLQLQIGAKKISLLNTHLAWAKTTIEQPHQTNQGEILLNYLQTVEQPFILSGDFNIDPNQPLIAKVNSLARNVVVEHQVTTTLNPRQHRAKVLFPPGAVVDYLFVSKNLQVKKFAVIDELDLSDHFALTAEVEI
ncbi:MAG TPA: endonuclease/exonuclease/phosphatase family protein [Patescibacteria group bacterium]